MRLSPRAAATIAAAILSTGALAATGDSGAAAVDVTADATTGAGTLDLRGTLTFGGLLEAGIDGAGDAVAPVGVDFTRASVIQDGLDVVFILDVSDQIPAAGTAPDTIQIGWELITPGGELGLTAWGHNANADARRLVNQGQAPSGASYFAVNVCEASPTGQSCTGTRVEGAFADGQIVWRVPLSLMGVAPGEEIDTYGGTPIHATPGAAGAAWFNPGLLSIDEMTAYEPFAVGGRVVVEVLDTAGQTVRVATTNSVGGAWSVSLADLAPGDYSVEVSSAYANSSDTETLTVTIP